MVDLAVAVDVGGEPVGEGVDAFRPDPVETAREFVGTLTELAAGMEVCQDELDRRDPEFGMGIDRDTASVILNRDGPVRVNGYRDE